MNLDQTEQAKIIREELHNFLSGYKLTPAVGGALTMVIIDFITSLTNSPEDRTKLAHHLANSLIEGMADINRKMMS